ncbi:hypothetical protein [Actinoplanes sp. NPDC049265]|uniref:hypothetical protein n=1 Tax=Actinoplanes sp. NPDC049265 TaxID=3363902 RepID=UPI00370FB7A2
MPDPIFYSIVVVDVERFGQRTNPMQASLRAAMYEVVRTAFADVRRDGEIVRLDRGDGIVMLVPTATADSVTLAGRFVDALDRALREKSRMFSAEHQMRMRVALHQGNCLQDEHGWQGEAINTAARLVDAQELRDALAAAPDAAMALIVSDEIYRGVVRHGYRYIDPASFARITLAKKELHEDAWISVPGHPSPPLIRRPERRSESSGPAAPTTTVYGPQVNNGDYVRGDKVGGDVYHFGGPR